MKALMQRVSEANVAIKGKGVGNIAKGILVFLCAVRGDTEQDVLYIIRKVSQLRIFEDGEGKMNRSVKDVNGEVLVVSQFTLAANTRKGNRPSFADAEEPSKAESLYDDFVRGLKDTGLAVRTGVFAEPMAVSLVNDGPVTILIDSRDSE